MKEKTHISQVIEGNSNRDKYDTEVKKILGDKTILAWIMKYSMEEFKNYTIEEARECIEGTPDIATVKVRPGAVCRRNEKSRILILRGVFQITQFAVILRHFSF